jgi:hypothetical protein
MTLFIDGERRYCAIERDSSIFDKISVEITMI